MLNELLASIFFQIDILVIQPIAGATMVGKYNSAYKFISAMAAISPAVIMPLFPALARARGDSSQMRLWIQRAWRPMILLAAPAVILFTLFGREIVYTFWGDPFLPEAGTLLAVLIWVVPFLYLNGLFQYVLIATDQLRSIAISFSLASMLNIALNILLLQQMGIVGAAYATIATEIVLLVLFSLALRDRQNLVSPLRPSIRPIAAAFLMSASALLLRELGWLIASVTSLIIYLTAVVATRAMTREDLKFLRSSVRN
jgi:O-antigen/teichoic acid export membrane protein